MAIPGEIQFGDTTTGDATLPGMDESRGDLLEVRKILAGERDRYAALVTKHSPSVAAIVARRVPRADVEEVVHEVFVRAYHSLGGFRGEQPLSHWLSRIAVRECYDRWRRERRRVEDIAPRATPDEQQWLEHAATPQAIARELEEEDRRLAIDLFHRALALLTPEDRAVLVLVSVEERSVAEAAKLLGWSSVNVKVRAHRARKRLVKAVERLSRPDGGKNDRG